MSQQNKHVPSWLIPVAAAFFVLLISLIVGASRPCCGDCKKPEEKKHDEHSFIKGANEQDYLTVAGPDGNSIKVSQKLSKMISYLTDNNITDNNNPTEKTVESWKAKMVNNIVTPSMSNFMDIVELGNVLNAEK